jgi:hypothetical protein
MVLALSFVFCTDLETDSDFCFVRFINWFVLITVVGSVYCAVRISSSYTADYF